MISTQEAIKAARAKIGTRYGSGTGEIDCINLIKHIIRTCPGGKPGYTTAGTNALWASRYASAKYRDVTAWRALSRSDSGRAGELLAMVNGSACGHVGLACGDGTVIHASQSRGAVVCTRVAGGGWTHALTHRYIETDDGEADMSNELEPGNDSAEGTGAGNYIVCADGGLRQRDAPGGRYMQMIPDGTQIEITQTRDGWGKTVWRGHAGWVSLDYLCAAGGND